MPTDEENVQFLYQVLMSGGTPNVSFASDLPRDEAVRVQERQDSNAYKIDFKAVAEALDLKVGATNKRWSRLKQTMAQNKAPPATTYQFLWFCVKHSEREKVCTLQLPQLESVTSTTCH